MAPLAGLALLLAGCEARATPVFQAPTPGPTSSVAGVSISAPAGGLGPGATTGGSVNPWDPRVAIVFPVFPPGQGGDIIHSTSLNVSVWPINKVLCTALPGPEVDLYVAKNNDAGTMAQAGTLMPRKQGGVSFPSLEFNDVRASLAADPKAKFSLVAMANGQPVSNVWVHGGPTPPTYTPLTPTGYGSPNPVALDARIQVVFPHDELGKPAPATSATRVNIAVDLFEHGTALSVPPSATYTPRLWWAEGNAQLQPALPGVDKTTYTVKGQGYPRWVFHNVPVQPGQTYHFLATLDSVPTFPSIWTHGPLGAPIPPPKPPAGCIP
jgi:hypothetical protein